MNIQQIKEKTKQASLTIVQQFEDKEKQKPTPWGSHWDNENRIRVTMHMDVFNQLKANPAMEGLALKEELIPANGDRKPYTRFVVITPANILGTF